MADAAPVLNHDVNFGSFPIFSSSAALFLFLLHSKHYDVSSFLLKGLFINYKWSVFMAMLLYIPVTFVTITENHCKQRIYNSLQEPG